MKTLEAKSWREFLEVIDVFHQPGFVFRGVCSERHELVPKVGRKETLTRYSLDQEQLLLDIFKQRARAHINPLPQGDLEWLSLAQHHGLPTRLLDWTLSPIIALYFAVREDITNDAAVYACHLPRDDPKFDPFKIHRVYKYYPPHISPRIPAQQALFTVHPSPTTPLKEELHKEDAGREVTKVVIPGKLRLCFLKKLSFFGINNETMFPGLDGTCLHLNWRYVKGVGYWGKPVYRP